MWESYAEFKRFLDNPLQSALFLALRLSWVGNDVCSIPSIIIQAVFSPGRGLAGFPQENLRWHIKSQEDAPTQRQAMSQTDFGMSTVKYF